MTPDLGAGSGFTTFQSFHSQQVLLLEADLLHLEREYKNRDHQNYMRYCRPSSPTSHKMLEAPLSGRDAAYA